MARKLAHSKAQIMSLDFAVSSCYRKIVNVKLNENVRLCMDILKCDEVDTLLAKRKQKLVILYVWTVCCANW